MSTTEKRTYEKVWSSFVKSWYPTSFLSKYSIKDYRKKYRISVVLLGSTSLVKLPFIVIMFSQRLILMLSPNQISGILLGVSIFHSYSVVKTSGPFRDSFTGYLGSPIQLLVTSENRRSHEGHLSDRGYEK